MVKVNENCIGCGACNAVCPDVFDFNDEGKVENIMGEDIPEDLMDAVKEAAEGCPVKLSNYNMIMKRSPYTEIFFFA